MLAERRQSPDPLVLFDALSGTLGDPLDLTAPVPPVKERLIVRALGRVLDDRPSVIGRGAGDQVAEERQQVVGMAADLSAGLGALDRVLAAVRPARRYRCAGLRVTGRVGRSAAFLALGWVVVDDRGRPD